MDAEKLKEILSKHTKWLNNEADGERANLRLADFRSVNLRLADLRLANLRSADLRLADLRSANLRSASLQEEFIQIGPVGSRKDYIVICKSLDYIATGCFHGTRKQFIAMTTNTP